MSESVLVKIARGDDGAMDECLDQYGGLVWSIARRLCVSVAETEDAVQDVFVELWKSAPKFDATKSAEKTFVAIVARRRVIDRLRSRMRRPATQPFEESFATEERVGEALEVQEEATKARRMMNELRSEERMVLELAVDQGLSQTEIAKQIGMPLGTVKTHARRGMIRLRELLTDGSAEGRAI